MHLFELFFVLLNVKPTSLAKLDMESGISIIFLQIISFLLKKIINLWSVKWRWLAFALQWSDCYADFCAISKECKRVPFSTQIREIYAWWPPAKEKNRWFDVVKNRKKLGSELAPGADKRAFLWLDPGSNSSPKGMDQSRWIRLWDLLWFDSQSPLQSILYFYII